MSFYPIDILPRYDPARAQKVRTRWGTEDGQAVYEKIVGLIRKGGGEDFLQWDFEKGRLAFVEDQWDLAGIELFNENIVFPKGDNFEAIDFSYARFWHSVFTNATFPQTGFRFTRLYNVEFRDCIFAFATFYGATLEKCKFINCDFVDSNGFDNCNVKDTKFEDCFFRENVFENCKFDENVTFAVSRASELSGMLTKTSSGFKDTLKKEMVTGIYRGIKEGFLAGQVSNKAREYFFLQQYAYTRYNRTRPFDKAAAYMWEIITGYGLRPIRVLVCLIVLFIVVCSWFAYRLASISESLIFSAGAFLTFGARSELLQGLTLLDHIIYIAAAFAGIALIALFITVMANVHLKNN